MTCSMLQYLGGGGGSGGGRKGKVERSPGRLDQGASIACSFEAMST
jgi:hypothetical protein